jgi:hypothetical protein
MDLSKFFLQVEVNYDRLEGLDTPTQKMLSSAEDLLSEHAPPGIKIIGSGG